MEDWLKDKRWKACYRNRKLAEGQKKACCRDGKLTEE